jgi:uncharacterized RDD family membrane protein YckC
MDNFKVQEEEYNSSIWEKLDNRVGFGRRLGAYLIDTLLILILGLLLMPFLGDSLASIFFEQQLVELEKNSNQLAQLGFDFENVLNSLINFSVLASILTVLLFVLEGAIGQSVGKIILNIHNTNLDGSLPSAKKLWIRSLCKYGSKILSLIGGFIGASIVGSIGSLWGIVIFIGFFFVLSDKKQSIHDMLAKTAVCSK